MSPATHFVGTTPAVAMDGAGNFAVTWTSEASGTFASYFQRFDAAGQALGGPVPASPASHFVTEHPAIAMDSGGDFVVAWGKTGTSPFAPYFQRFDAMGVAQGGAVQASPATHFSTAPPSVAMAADGRFVIGWNEEGSLFAAFAQPFTSTGAPVGPALQANQTGFVVPDSLGGDPLHATVAVGMDCDTNFVVVWTDVGATFAAFAREFDATGTAIGPESQVSPVADFVFAPPAVGVRCTSEPQFVRGDCNADSSYNIADAVGVLGFLFPNPAPPAPLACSDACDCNDDGLLNIADAICILAGLFGSPTVPPPSPHPGCGPDPTADALDCAAFPCP